MKMIMSGLIVDAVSFDEITSEVCNMKMSEIASVLGVQPYEMQRSGSRIDLLSDQTTVLSFRG